MSVVERMNESHHCIYMKREEIFHASSLMDGYAYESSQSVEKENKAHKIHNQQHKFDVSYKF